MIKNASIILVIFGSFALIFALRFSISLYKKDRRTSTFSFIPLLLSFLLGYTIFAYFLILKEQTTIIELIVSLIFFGGGLFCMMLLSLISQSMTRIALAEFQKQHGEIHDKLTSLPNRHFFIQAINKKISQYQLDKQPFYVVTISLTNFNNINEIFGQQKGDLILCQFADRLNKHMSHELFLSRTAGYRFSFILSLTNKNEIINFIKRIQYYMDYPLSMLAHKINLTNIVGIAAFPENGHSAEDILKRAEIAMYNAKHQQIPFAIFEPTTSLFYDANELALMLHSAMNNMDFVLNYQPVLDIQNPQLPTFEVLIRWQLANGYCVRPDEFIPIAEKTNAILHITRWVLETSLKQLAKWKKQGLTPHVQVNLSAKDIEDNYLISYLTLLLNRYSIDPTQLTLEITETSMMQNPKKSRHILEKIQNLGVSLSIDDFGTGFSSLSILSNMPIDEIKIDRSFVSDLLTRENHEAIVRSTIYLAHSLNCRVVAEGVETEDLCQYLTSLGCDKLQGYWYGRPMSLEQTEIWLKQNNDPLKSQAG